MSKHEYRFGDRVTISFGGNEPVARGIFLCLDPDEDAAVVLEGDEESRWFEWKHLTPGWPVPEGCVRVRAVVVVTEDGNGPDWEIVGRKGYTDEHAESSARVAFGDDGFVHFIEADIPLPTTGTYRAEVVS